LRAGTSGDSGVLVYSCAYYHYQSAHEAAGASGIRRSPRPLWAETKCNASGASRREDEVVCENYINVIASQRVGAKRRPMTGSAKQSILTFFTRQDGLLRRKGSSQ
jgi:hypothetical protein